MKTHQKLMKLLTITLFSALLLGIIFVVAGSSKPNMAAAPVASTEGTIDVQPAAPASPGETNTINPNPPSEVVKMVFVHHSCGNHWLSDSDGGLRQALNANSYFVLDVSYGWGPPDEDVGTGTIGDHTDIGHWYNWFAGPHRDTYLNALYTTDHNAGSNSGVTDPGGESEIIMFKSCYPNSRLKGNPDDPPTVGDNPLRGRIPFTPYHTVANAKGIYNDILEYFQTRQDKLFVVITAPPLLDDTYADNARAFNNWLVHDWLADYPYHNVVVFDFYNVLTTNGGDADTNDYGLPTGNHHRVVTTTTPITIEHITDGDDDASPNILEYPTGGGTNDHPSPAGNQKATGEFVPLLNAYYNCWKHGDCWDDSPDWISVTAVTDVASIYPDETATYTLSVTASEGITDPATLTLEGEPSGATVSFDPNPVTPPGTSQLDITTAASTAAGTYAMTVTGTTGQVTDTVPLTLIITEPTLTLSAEPDVRTITAGNTATYTLSVTASEGFADPATLTLQGEPSGATISFDPNPVTPPGASQLYVTTTISTMAGTYVMTITGTTGQVTDTVPLTLIVTEPTLTLNAEPDVRTVTAGNTATYTLSVTASEGFADPATLTLQGEPSGTTVSFDPNPVTPPGASQLRITTTTSTVAGTYAMTATASSGALTDTANLTLIVASETSSFTLSISPTTRIAKPNQVVSYTVTVTGVNGFSQPVTLTLVGLPTDIGTAWSVNPVTPDNSSILTLSIPSSPPFGNHPLQVVAITDTQVVAEGIRLIITYPFKMYLPIILK